MLGEVLFKAFQPSVSVFCSQECFDAMRRYDMTFGIRAYVSQCQEQVQSWDDWPWDHYIGKDEHVNQVHLTGWLSRHLGCSHWEGRGWMKGLKDFEVKTVPLAAYLPLRKPWSWGEECSQSNGTGFKLKTSGHVILPVKSVSTFSYQALQSWVFPSC